MTAAGDGYAVVGVDGSKSADLAVDWAVAEARRRDLSLQLVALWQAPAVVAGPSSVVAAPTMIRVARRRATDAVERALTVAAAARVDAAAEVIEGHPSTVLGQLARGADQLVVGARGLSVLGGVLRRSTSTVVIRHPGCPITVVRGRASPPRHRVVVGVDGSPAAAAALHRAAVEAAAANASLQVVAAWRATDPELVTEFAGAARPGPEEVAELARVRAEALVHDEDLPVPVSVQVTHGDAAAVLTAAAAHGDLLVVGTNSKGAWDRLLLGSVSARCVRAASCPVQVVPARP